MSQPPQLAVLVPYVNGPAELRECLAALVAESQAVPLQVIVADRVGDADQVLTPRPDAILIVPAPNRSIPEMRAVALARATAPTVAIIEDHVIVPPGWAAAVVAARATGDEVIAGPIDNLATSRLVDRAAFLCEYSQLIPPIAGGEVATLPGNNTAYDRGLLTQYAAIMANGGWEDRVHQAMRRDGIRLVAHPELVAGHRMHYTTWLYTTQRFLYSRAYAGERLAGASTAGRAFAGLARLALPPVLLGRIIGAVFRKGRMRRELLQSLPLIAWFVTVWAAGEMIGAWLGPGDAPRRIR